MLHTCLQCLQSAHVCGHAHHRKISFVTQHGNSDDGDAVCLCGLHGCNKIITLEIREWLAKKMDDPKADRGGHRFAHISNLSTDE